MKSACPRKVRNAFFFLAAIFGALILSCATTPPADPPPPTGLPPIMRALRRASRDFKRALILENTQLLQERAPELTAAAAMLESVSSPPEFSALVRDLVEQSKKVRAAQAKNADPERLAGLFSDLIASCTACHHRFRPE